jgi:hypothetical protein
MVGMGSHVYSQLPPPMILGVVMDALLLPLMFHPSGNSGVLVVMGVPVVMEVPVYLVDDRGVSVVFWGHFGRDGVLYIFIKMRTNRKMIKTINMVVNVFIKLI